ncbi:MAG TPA: hypothetical protein VHY08_04105 [Bacillota bacterium]|nr:hypothetical protein [Bacillota bacterium]
MGHKHRSRDKFDIEALVPVIVSVLRQFNNKETKAAPVTLEAIDTKAVEDSTENKSDLKNSLLKVLSQLDTSNIKESNVLDLIKKFKKE